MATIQDKIKACDYVIANMLSEQARIIRRNENKIIALNTGQFENGIGSDDKRLINSDKRYSGRYTYFTQQVALYENPIAPKVEGSLYNFAWNGDFLRGMYVYIEPNNETIFLDSTGTGSGSKAKFFSGYNNLFGLNKRSEEIVNYDIILPELLQWIKKYI